MANERHDAAFIVGAVIGGLAAGAYALLEAPQAGAVTRSQLAERGDAAAERLARAAAEVDGRVRGWLVDADERAAPLLRRVTALGGSTAADSAAPAAGSVVETEPFITLPDPLEPDPVLTAPEVSADADADLIVDVPRITEPNR